MGISKIEWTEVTWNPITGCSKISDGCLNCYAANFAKRLQAMGNIRYANGFQPTVHMDLIDLPFHWKTPKRVFVNSMSDIFHEQIPDKYILQIFDTMNQCRQHEFQVLTKRPERLSSLNDKIVWTDNIWMGVTIESDKYLNRADMLRNCGARIKFVSAEPLLSRLNNLNLTDIDWLIVGGESGPHCRPIKKEWVEELLNLAKDNNTAFFFKQWGGFNKKKNGKLLNGLLYQEYPSKIK